MNAAPATDYTRIARDYDRDRAEFLSFDDALAEALSEALEEAASAGAPARLLDVGCGTGTVLSALGEKAGPWRAWQRLGLDFNQSMLAVSRSKVRDCPLIRASATALPTRSGSIGCLISTFAFHHFGGLRAFLDECRRVLAPGGTAVLRNILPREGPASLLYDFFEGTREIDARRFPLRSELLTALEAGGLELRREVRTDGVHEFTPARFADLCRGRTISQLDLIAPEQFAAGMARLEALARDGSGELLRECVPVYTFRCVRPSRGA